MKKSVFILSFMGLFVIFSCKDNHNQRQEMSSRSKLERKYDRAQDFTFTNWVLKDSDSVRKIFRNTFTASQLQTIVALNRVDKSTFHTIDTLVIPDRFDDDFLAYAPFPYTIEEAKEINKLAVFHYKIQAYGVYENGEYISGYT